MRNTDWTKVQAAGDFARLDAGLYVFRIVDVKDDESKEMLEIVFDVNEGANAGVFANDAEWAHTCRKGYGEKSEAFFKQFLEVLEDSNAGRFTIAGWQSYGCHVETFKGLVFGGAWQEYTYIPQSGAHAGETRKGMEIAKFFAAQDVRNGTAKLPAPRDARTDEQKQEAALEEARKAATANATYDDIPFS